MQIDCRNAADGTCILCLSGRLDFSRRQEFLNVMEQFLAQAPVLAELQVDCAQLSYIDSSGLGMLLILRDRSRKLGGSVALLDCGEEIRNILNTVQFGRLFRMG